MLWAMTATSDNGKLISGFLESLRGPQPDEKLAKALDRLDDEARVILGEVLQRFDRARAGALDGSDVLFATRVLNLLHRPSQTGLESVRKILAYLDCDTNRVLDHQEVTLATEVLELFCKADSENDTLSNKELEVLIAVLESIDKDGNGVLDLKERAALRDELWDPAGFLAKHKEENAKVRALLS